MSGVKVSSVEVSGEAQHVKGYHRLEVWHKAHLFALKVYQVTANFPEHEKFGLTSQLRRAALSVPVNIVEGQASASKKEFLNFLNIANRSLVEAEYLLEVARALGYLSGQVYKEVELLRQSVGNLLTGLMRSLRARLRA